MVTLACSVRVVTIPIECILCVCDGGGGEGGGMGGINCNDYPNKTTCC